MADAPCRPETERYRQCMKDGRQSGRRANCNSFRDVMEKCREKWRKENDIVLNFDHTRVLPPPQCKLLNDDVQACLTKNNVSSEKCRKPILELERCMQKYPCPTKPN